MKTLEMEKMIDCMYLDHLDEAHSFANPCGPKFKGQGALRLCLFSLCLWHFAAQNTISRRNSRNQNDEKDKYGNSHKTPPVATQDQLFIDQLIEHRHAALALH